MIRVSGMRRLHRWSVGVVVAALLFSSVTGQAMGAMVSTQAAVAAEQERHIVSKFIQRQDVAAQLQALGVAPQEAQARAASLSDAEVAQLAARIQELPAGGADVLGLLVFVFLVLLITDILGYTDIFPFVKKTAQ